MRLLAMVPALVCCHAATALAFSPTPVVLGLRAAPRHLRAARTDGPAAGVCMAAHVDRRNALAAVAIWQLAELAVATSSVQAAGDPAKLVEAALKKINSVPPEKIPNFVPVPFEELCIAVVDDGSPLAKAAIAGVKGAGGLAVPLKGDAQKMQETYLTFKDKPDDPYALSPIAAIVPDTKALKSVMSGSGLLCEKCGFGGGSSAPKFILVMDGKGKDDKTLQQEGDVSGRQCSDSGCFQVGIAVPVYGVEGFSKREYNPDTGLFDK